MFTFILRTFVHSHPLPNHASFTLSFPYCVRAQRQKSIRLQAPGANAGQPPTPKPRRLDLVVHTHAVHHHARLAKMPHYLPLPPGATTRQRGFFLGSRFYGHRSCSQGIIILASPLSYLSYLSHLSYLPCPPCLPCLSNFSYLPLLPSFLPFFLPFWKTRDSERHWELGKVALK